MSDDPFRLTGVVIEQRYRVVRPVAEGGFGVVYDATHLALETRVALKVLKTPPEMNDAAKAEFIAKFVLEAKTVARIRHQNIVQVLDTGVSVMPSGERAPWIALEWLDGITLEDDFQRVPVRSPSDALELLRPIFQAVAYAHDEGIAHRDLKPSNVMLVRGRRGWTPKLLDFGIAKLMAEGEQAGTGHTRTQSRMTGFSPAYGSPEQAGNMRTGPWTDVHALALIMTQALVGYTPLPVNEMTETLREILSPQRPTPAKFGLNVGAWEAVLQRAAAYKPDARFPNAGEFLAALEATLPQAGPGHPDAPRYASLGAGSPGSSSGAFAALSDGRPKSIPPGATIRRSRAVRCRARR
jgi:serine/threonine protein kinase